VSDTKSKQNEREDEMEDIRLICEKCGACAGHVEDRDGNGRCLNCGCRATVVQERNKNGEWVNVE